MERKDGVLLRATLGRLLQVQGRKERGELRDSVGRERLSLTHFHTFNTCFVFAQRFSVRRLWGLVHDSQGLAQKLHIEHSARGNPLDLMRDPGARLQVSPCFPTRVTLLSPTRGLGWSLSQ